MHQYVLIGVFLVLLTLYIYHLFFSHPSQRYPPGPTPWPVIGNLFLLSGKSNLDVFAELAKKYGQVVFLRVAKTNVLLLNNLEVIKEAFVKEGDVFNNKPTNTIMSHMNKNTGIVSSNGEIWKEHRNFTVKWLQTLGFGPRRMEEPIKKEIFELIDAIQEKEGEPFDPRKLLFPSILNVTWALVAGQRFSLDDPSLHSLMNALQENLQLGVQSGSLNFMAWLRHVPVVGSKYWKMKTNLNSIYAFLNTVMDEHKLSLENDSDCSNLLREYLKKAKKNSNEETIKEAFTDEQIRRVITDLFVAGSETTVTTLSWALLLLVRHEELQSKLHDEIDDVLTDGKEPTADDRERLHLLKAFLAEVQRFGVIVPIVSHANSRETTFHGYFIPEDTVVLANFWSLMRDPNLWEKPEEFNPRRFLDDQGNFRKPGHFIPFSIGKRKCLGESLAQMELFLYLTSLLQKFSFHAEGQTAPSLEHVPGVTMSPKPFRIIATPRYSY